MSQDHQRSASHVFLVRMWLEPLAPDETEWRGQVQLLASGVTRYFRDWTALAPLLQTMLAPNPRDPEPTHNSSERDTE